MRNLVSEYLRLVKMFSHEGKMSLGNQKYGDNNNREPKEGKKGLEGKQLLEK